MKKLTFILTVALIFSLPSFAKDKLLVVFLFNDGSPSYQKIHNKILKDKYLSKRIKKSFDFKEVSLSDPQAEVFIKRYGIDRKEGVYFINPASGTLLYAVTDLNQPCKCANLINYFSRNLHKKGIDPDEYLIKAEKIGAYKVKVEDNYLF
ncbi:hypothetical protein [Persephonella sp.]